MILMQKLLQKKDSREITCNSWTILKNWKKQKEQNQNRSKNGYFHSHKMNWLIKKEY